MKSLLICFVCFCTCCSSTSLSEVKMPSPKIKLEYIIIENAIKKYNPKEYNFILSDDLQSLNALKNNLPEYSITNKVLKDRYNIELSVSVVSLKDKEAEVALTFNSVIESLRLANLSICTYWLVKIDNSWLIKNYDRKVVLGY